MFETRKIDTFFSGEKNLLDEEEEIFISRRTKVVRFLKLFLPCLTAALLGLGVVLFDFETNSETSLGITAEDKIYFEKFRMKNTVFEITEKDNQLSTLKAEVVEETVPGEKLYNLVRPDARTLDKGRIITLTSKTGKFNQNSQELVLEKEVIADYNKQMKIFTNSATYNFKSEKGFGNEEISGSGERGSFRADRFDFDKNSGQINLVGNIFMKSNNATLETKTQATLFMHENKFVADNATLTKEQNKLKGKTITAFFKDMKSFDLIKLVAEGNSQFYSEDKTAYADKSIYTSISEEVELFGNVKIKNNSGYVATADYGIYDAKTKIFTLKDNVKVVNKDGYNATAHIGIYDLTKKTFTLKENVLIDRGTNVISAPKAIYFANAGKFRFYDDVTVTQDDCVATAQSGVYYIKRNIAELEHNVIIRKNGNEVRGDKAISDFKTSTSRLIAKDGGRISGKLIENTIKDK